MAYSTSRSTGARRPLPRRLALCVASLSAMLLVGDPLPASACGCFTPPDPAAAIVQAGENIVFSVENGQVTAYIQIQYAGDAKDFGWLLPLPSVPTLEVGSDELFSTLTATTAPRYHTSVTWPKDCNWNQGGAFPGAVSDLGIAFSEADGGAGGGGPQSPLVAEGGIGPYDYAVLKADSKQAMLDWLGQNHYFVPSGTDSVVTPYIHPGAYFLALKLHSGAQSGDIQPVVVHYASDLPMIPIVLTSVTSSPNLGVWVWVLGSARAIPRNYHHAVVDDAALAWTQYDSGYAALANYEEVVSRAVKSAPDKHAFVTEMAGPTAPLVATLFPPTRFGDLDLLRSTTDAGNYLDYLLANRYSFNGALVTLLSKYIKQPEGLTSLTGQPVSAANYYYNFRYWQRTRPEAFVGLDLTIDAKALTDEIEVKIVKPVRDAQKLFEKAKYLTRLHTWLAPADMTADPVFSFNPSLPDVNNQHDASMKMRCGFMPWTYQGALTTEQGFVLDSTQTSRPILPWALRIENLREAGPPEVITDNTEAIRALLGFNAGGGGGCTVDGRERAPSSRTALLLGLLPLAFVLRAARRRRRSS